MAKSPATRTRTRKAAPSKKAPAKGAQPSPAPKKKTTTPTRKRLSVREGYRQRNGECSLDLVEGLVFKLRQGIPVDRACDLIGLHRSKYTTWCKWGEDYLEAPDDEVAQMSKEDRDKGEIYAYLYIATKSAIAEHLESIISGELNSTSGLWKKGLSILERRDAHNWARVRSRHIGIGDELGDQFTPDPTFL